MLYSQKEIDNKIDSLFKEQMGCERIDNSEKYVIKLLMNWYASNVLEDYKINRFKTYSIWEVCKILDISKRTLQTLRDKKEIEFIQKGNKIYFLEEHIENYFKQ